MKKSSNQPDKYFSYFLPTVIFISVLAGCLAMGPYLFNSDGDLGRHITLGSIILERGEIPTIDEFSHTRLGDPFSPHEWIAEVLFALAYIWFGLSGVVLFSGVLLGLVFWLLTYRVLLITRSTPITLILIVIGLAASRIHWLARPHIFTFLFLLLLVELLQSRMKFIWKVILYCVLQVLWVNTHGAFVSGLVVLGIFILGEILQSVIREKHLTITKLVKEYLVLMVMGLFISLINPDGFKIWTTIFGFLTSRYLVSHTAEYQPPVLYQTGVLPFTIMLVLSIVCIILAWKKLSFYKLLLLLFFGVFGVTSGRNIPLFILLALPILAEGFSPLFPRFRMQLDSQLDSIEPDGGIKQNPAIYLILLIVFSFAFGGLIYKILPGISERNVHSPEKFPVAAVEWLQRNPQKGKIFNDFMWGGYLLLKAYPDIPVFIDGQTDFYGEGLTRDYEIIINAWDGWDEKLSSYQVDWVLIRTDSPLWNLMKDQKDDWTLVYADATSVITRRKD